MKELEKIIARTLCFRNQSICRPINIFNNDAYILDFRSQKFPLIFLNLNPFKHQQALHFGVLNYEEGTCKVSGRWVIFSAFYADFCLCPKSVIITTSKKIFSRGRKMKCSGHLRNLCRNQLKGQTKCLQTESET